MPKLFVASGIFHPEAGGPATYLKELLPALQGVGWQPRVLTYGAPQTADYGYPVRRIARGPLPLRRAKYALAAAGSLAWADIVYAQTIDLPLWGRRTVPRVIKVVGDQAWERCVRKRWLPADMGIDAFQTYQGDWRARWQKNARSRQVAAMDAVIVPSQYLKEMVINWGVAPEKIHVIYNALPPLPLSASRAEIRAELNWDQQPTLVTVARLQPWKGIDYLIQALRDLPELRLVVVGDGPDRPRLQRLAAPLGQRVQFTGQLGPAQAQRRMRAADGLALYSGYEGLSHTLLESLRLGTPALASDVGGNPEILRHGVNGLLLPYGDVAALRQGIAQFFARRAEFVANSQVGLERFRFETMLAQTDRVLRGLLR